MLNQIYKTTIALFFISIIYFAVFPVDVSGAVNFQVDEYLPLTEVRPEPVGGLAAIYKKINYPDFAKQTRVEGKVYVMVMINEQGGVDDAKIIKGIGGGCDEEVLNVIKRCKFTAAKNKGVAVKSKLSIPITFKLQ